MRYRRARHMAWRVIAGETVLLDLERKRMYGLNPAAAGVWLALDEADDQDQLLRAATGVASPAAGEHELAHFLDQLVALGLAQVRPPAESSLEDGAPAGSLTPVAPGSPERLEPPAILWQEEVEQIAGTCAMFPSTSPICNQAPFS